MEWINLSKKIEKNNIKLNHIINIARLVSDHKPEKNLQFSFKFIQIPSQIHPKSIMTRIQMSQEDYEIYIYFNKTTQEQLNAMTPSEYDKWSTDFVNLYQKYFPNYRINVPRPKSHEEMAREREENRKWNCDLFKESVETALKKTLNYGHCNNIEDYQEIFKKFLKEIFGDSF